VLNSPAARLTGPGPPPADLVSRPPITGRPVTAHTLQYRGIARGAAQAKRVGSSGYSHRPTDAW
jgi:hypothetical protein